MYNFKRNILQIGIQENQVLLKPYTAFWKWIYLLEKIRLKISLHGHINDIQHVGSTAIPSISSKPIIDICLAVSNLRTSMLYVQRIEKLGYQYKGANASIQQHSFVKGKPIPSSKGAVRASGSTLPSSVFVGPVWRISKMIENEG